MFREVGISSAQYREPERETDRQIDRETDRQRQREGERQTEKGHRERGRDTPTKGWGGGGNES